MLSTYNDVYIQSPKTDVIWAGFRSDTVTLQRNGWLFSVEENHYNRSVRLVMKHPTLEIYAISKHVNFGYGLRDIPFFEVEGMTQEIRFCTTGTYTTFDSFKPVDMNPRMFREENISNFDIFHKVNINVEEIYLQEASLNDILELALKKQYPIQEDIRRRKLEDKRLIDFKAVSECRAELRLAT